MRSVVARAAAILALVGLTACSRTPKFEGVAIDPPRAMPSFTFVRADSTEVVLGPEQGRPLVLFFGYTHCPDVCPTTLADWTRVKSMLGARAERVRWVFVSVDPERDTPVIAQRYASQFDRAFIGVSSAGAVTSEIMNAYGVTSARDEGQETAAGYLVSHSSQVFLVNDAGELVALYPFGTRWESLAADLKLLLDRDS